MTLKKYQEKRDFRATTEPKGNQKKSAGKQLHFVVHKHDASRLHYDFRLESQGVLKSWAVPKGPSLNPQEKRLAIMVEDHPFDYKDFEGIIPKGHYGAGSVIIWDQGVYHPAEGAPKKKSEAEKLIQKGLAKGELKIILEGEKLKGEFVLVQTHQPQKNAWLLIKKRDDFSSTEDVRQEDRSVVSGKTIEDISNPTDPPKKKVL